MLGAGFSNCCKIVMMPLPKVRILVNDNAVYVADNGCGLKPEAVDAICRTHSSNKTSGTIGRKGVGFKSVYAVSSNPQALTVNGEGIEFSRDKAKEWLKTNGFDDRYMPYQWIPFPVSWDQARQEDPTLDTLKELKEYKTVIRLPVVSPEEMSKVGQLLREWPPHALFAFRHVRRIVAPPDLEVVLTPDDEVWRLDDSRGNAPESWRVAKDSEPEHPLEELLEPLGTDERETIKANGVGFLIAAPLVDNCVVPTKEYLPVHVFHPTEQKGPVRLLLHAEFLVKSDRTTLIPIEDSPFNTWVAERLACRVGRFVTNAYRRETPSSHAALLAPFEGRESHPVAKTLWERIAKIARNDLRLADVEGKQRLTVEEARLVSVTVRPDLARKLLEATDVRGDLLHCSFDEDQDARKALKALGCEEINDQDVRETISENAASLAADKEWIWACWEWLAAWVAKEPHSDKHGERVKRTKELPVVPVNRRLRKPSELEGRIVTWKTGGHTENLPDWLPLTFVDDWFRDRMQELTKQAPAIKTLRENLGIQEPSVDVVQRAVGQAIEQFWKEESGDPARFLSFILKQNWHETSDNKASPPLKRCPVRLSRPLGDQEWAEAGKAYFGRQWENALLADLYKGMKTVAWVGRNSAEEATGKYRDVLAWLGVADCPRIVKEKDETAVGSLPDLCSDWRKYLQTARDPDREIDGIHSLDRVSVSEIDEKQSVALVRLIAKRWDEYYRDKIKTTARETRGRKSYRRSWRIHAKWWWEVREKLALPLRGRSCGPVPLAKCWLPDKPTEKAIGDLLPVIDLDAFEDDKDIVHKWLVDVDAVGLRARIDEVTVEEWKELLSTRIPDAIPADRAASNEKDRDKITNWYSACLQTVSDKDEVSGIFAACPLLCRKGDSWRFLNDNPRYLDDDNDFVNAFSGDVWLFHVPSRLTADAVKYFGISSLSKSVEVRVEAGDRQAPDSRLQAKFDDSLPYIWTWRSSRSKQDTDKLLSRLKSLKVHVVPVLKAHLSLNGNVREVERHGDVIDDVLLLHADHANEDTLAQALAKAVGVISEADFYENLLRCNEAPQRKEKLLSKGMLESEVDRCLREYSRQSEAAEPDEEERTNSGREISPAPSISKGRDGAQPPGIGGSVNQRFTPAKPNDPAPARKPFRLKDVWRVDYKVNTVGAIQAPTGGSGGRGDEPTPEGHPLTADERDKLEKAGRTIAERELQKMGYEVEIMETLQPGFDLRGRRDGEELRVEVKTHMGKATVVEVTHRQYKECLGQKGYRWQLWNVEHLADQEGLEVTLTRYNDIPDDALDVRTFRVDLKRCRPLNE